jgi:hypothetical protein
VAVTTISSRGAVLLSCAAAGSATSSSVAAVPLERMRVVVIEDPLA